MQPSIAKANVEAGVCAAFNCEVGQYLRGVTENLALDWTFEERTTRSAVS